MDIYSGLVEAYGIYTMLSFFHQYSCLYPLPLKAPTQSMASVTMLASSCVSTSTTSISTHERQFKMIIPFLQ